MNVSLQFSSFAGKPPARWAGWIHQAAVVLAFGLVLAYGVRVLFERDQQPRLLADQVNELVMRAKFGEHLATDFHEADTTRLAPEVAALIIKFELRELTHAGLRHMTRDPALRLASDIGDSWAPTNRANEAIPGLIWLRNTLQHRWGGRVAVYMNDNTVLVTYSDMPQWLCEEVAPSARAGGMAYVFACNGQLTAVEHNSEWDVTAADLRLPVKAAADMSVRTP